MTDPVDFSWSFVATNNCGNAPNPHLIHQPSDIPAGVQLVYESSGTLTFGARTRPIFDFHWLRETALGVMGGNLGLQADSATEATMNYRLDGHFRAVVSLDADGRLRLRIEKSRDTQLQFQAQVTAEANATVPLPDQPDELVAAILGIHDQQWLYQLAQAGGSLSQFLEKWKALDPAAAAVIWKATAAGEELSRLQNWVHRIATELTQMPALESALWQSIESDPAFASSSAALWTEAVTGSLLAAATDAAKFHALVEAAAAADHLLSDQSLVDLLRQLKQQAAAHLAPGANLLESADEWVQKQLAGFLGGAGSVDGLQPILNLRDSIYQQLRAALEKKLSAELRWTYDSAADDGALMDCSFDFTPEGLRAYQDALGGNWSRILCQPGDHVRVHQGVLTHGLRRETHLELHLPFMDRKEWNSRLEALAKVEATAADDGRLLVYTVDASDRTWREGVYQSTLMLGGGQAIGQSSSDSHFTLAYTDQQSRNPESAQATLPAIAAAYGFDPRALEWLETAVAAEKPELVETSLHLSLPGQVVPAWLETPGEREAEFFPVFSKVSVAVQSAMRRWLPYAYFHDAGQYETLNAAFPLLVYQCSRPFAGQPRSDFSYDVMSEDSMAAVCRTAARGLPAALEGVERLLSAAGRGDTAAFYSPGQAQSILASVHRNPRLLQSLLVADAFYIDSLIKLGLKGREIAEAMPACPQKAVKELARFTADFVKTFHSRLRRLYGGQDFVALGSLLLVEATNALGAAQGHETRIRGILRLRVGDQEQTFVNADYGR